MTTKRDLVIPNIASVESVLKATNAHTVERSLIEAAQKAPRCFAELYERNFERIYAYIAGRVRNTEEAQDLTADVFHQALACNAHPSGVETVSLRAQRNKLFSCIRKSRLLLQSEKLG